MRSERAFFGCDAQSHAEAVDLHDPNGAIARWCMASNHSTLADLGLWIEHPDYTPGWCHLQTRPPRSGSRVFVPR